MVSQKPDDLYGDFTLSVLQVLIERKGKPIGPLAIANMIDGPPVEVSKRLATLRKAGKATKAARGQWVAMPA